MTIKKNVLLAMSFYHPQIHRGVSKYAAEHGWHLNAKMTTRSEPLWGWQGDGAIVQGPVSQVYRDFVELLSVPKVSMGSYRGWGCPVVDDDHQAIGRMAAKHFLTKGFRNFAVYCEYGSRPTSTQKSFIKFLQENGYGSEVLFLDDEKVNWQQQSDGLAQKLMQLPKPLAVFCDRDHAGLELINACLNNGIAVPGDVAILGKHNNSTICEASVVSLSSVDNDLFGMGYRTAELLDMILDGKMVPDKTLIAPKEVISRQSTEILAIRHEKVRRALIFIQENYLLPISLSEVADASAMSVRGLQEAFHRETGQSVNDQIIGLRIKKAKDLLLGTDRTVEVVAHDSGFKSLRNFHNLFKKATGQTPAGYRKQYRR